MSNNTLGYRVRGPGDLRSQRAARGFTLVELIIVLAVALILLTMAVPELSAVVHKNRIRATGSDLYASMSLARNEAIKRRRPVQVCPSANGTTCRNDGDWSAGWIVIVIDAGGNTVIRALDPPATGVQMQADNTVDDFVQFNPTGDAFTTFGEFRICHANTTVRSRAVRVSAAGRVESAERTANHCSV